MKLQSLAIKLNRWGPFDGHYTGEIEYEGEKGKVVMTLSPDVSNILLACCADHIAAMTAKTHDEFRAAIHQSIAEAKATPAITA